MSVSSNYLTILSSAATAISNLPLADWNGNSVPVAVRKMPRFRERIDTYLPLVCVSPGDQGERIERKVFGHGRFVWYPVEVLAVAPGNQDFNAHIDYYLGWRYQIRQLFQTPTLSGASPPVFDTKVNPNPVIDRGGIPKNYDEGALIVEFHAWEP